MAAVVAASAMLAESFMAPLFRSRKLHAYAIRGALLEYRSPRSAAQQTIRCALVRALPTAQLGSSGHHLNPPHAGDFGAAVADARDRLGDRLDGNRHVEGIGVQEAQAVAHDGDVAVPENEVTTSGLRGGEAAQDWRSQRLFLHVAVAWTGNSAGGERDLHQTRAIDAERRLAAPQ